jgi:hypothetical protein
MRNRSTIEFIRFWEQINNSDFKPTEFGRFRNESGSNGFVMTPSVGVKNCLNYDLYDYCDFSFHQSKIIQIIVQATWKTSHHIDS